MLRMIRHRRPGLSPSAKPRGRRRRTSTAGSRRRRASKGRQSANAFSAPAAVWRAFWHRSTGGAASAGTRASVEATPREHAATRLRRRRHHNGGNPSRLFCLFSDDRPPPLALLHMQECGARSFNFSLANLGQRGGKAGRGGYGESDPISRVRLFSFSSTRVLLCMQQFHSTAFYRTVAPSPLPEQL